MESAPVIDPLSGAAEIDPLSSFSPANDPLSTALLDPLSQAASEVSSFGAIEKKKVRFAQSTTSLFIQPSLSKDHVVPDVTFEPWSVKRLSLIHI